MRVFYECAIKGDVIDYWAALKGLKLRDAPGKAIDHPNLRYFYGFAWSFFTMASSIFFSSVPASPSVKSRSLLRSGSP